MDWIERIGLLKMDFLGLRNLTVMKNAVVEIRRTVNPDFDLDAVSFDDAKTYEMLGRGETMGVFQLESEGMKRVCAELQPSRFDDIIALVALYRPGPMELDPAIHREQARPLEAEVPPSQAGADPRRDLRHAGLSGAGDADRARHRGLYDGRSRRAAQGDGQEAEGQDPALPREVRGRRGGDSAIDRPLAERLFHFIEPFAGYGFNKSHAAAYGWIAYQTAYLKANYPLQYFAALMSSVKDKTDKLVEYIEEAKKIGIDVLPPDVNESLVDFAVVGTRFASGWPR